jgi:hypothetical protein
MFVSYSSVVYISGGLDEMGHGLRTIWRLDLDSLRWNKLPIELPKPLFFHSAAMTEVGNERVFAAV